MRSDASWGLKIGAAAGLLFLHLPLLLIFLYAFTTEEKSFQFPPPGFTTRWFSAAWFDRPDIWPPLYLSIKVAFIATILAIIFGTLAAAALSRAKFFGKIHSRSYSSCPSPCPASSQVSPCAPLSTSCTCHSRLGQSFWATRHFAS